MVLCIRRIEHASANSVSSFQDITDLPPLIRSRTAVRPDNPAPTIATLNVPGLFDTVAEESAIALATLVAISPWHRPQNGVVTS
jgi:hypothetical protein